MSVITISVVNPAETEKATMQVPTNVAVEVLIDEIVEQMELPLLTPTGQRTRYHLGLPERDPDPNTQRINVRRLDDKRNLEQNGVQDGAALQLTGETVDGSELSGNAGRIAFYLKTGNWPDGTSRYLIESTKAGSKPASKTERLEEAVTGIETRIDNLEQVTRDHRNLLQEYRDVLEILRQQVTPKADTNLFPPRLPHEQAPEPLSYLDFDITFVGQVAECKATALWLDENQPRDGCHSFKMPLSLVELELDYLRNMGLISRSGSREFGRATDLGRILFKAVFQETLGYWFRKCLDRARELDRGVRVRLDLRDAPALINYPWEFLHNEDDGGFLALSEYTPIIRYLRSTRETPPTPVQPPLQMLVVTASPTGLAQLNIEKEKENLSSALKEANCEQPIRDRLDRSCYPSSIAPEIGKSQTKYPPLHRSWGC